MHGGYLQIAGAEDLPDGGGVVVAVGGGGGVDGGVDVHVSMKREAADTALHEGGAVGGGGAAVAAAAAAGVSDLRPQCR